ncbi:hypothetical protein JCGZ_03696 [Jatropha curcas]|uniref:Uncharacterized protein n=1 Tax=Jatropha curcas TaxID=180498 RepID=A0A067L5M6_JATCU|nr:hypothetical protein JCGZ_03696 [Jatropha curcas]
MGQLKEDSGASKYKKPSQASKVHEVASITPMNSLRVGNMRNDNQSRRSYTDLGMPILLVFREAVKANYIKPLEARPPPNALPRNYKSFKVNAQRLRSYYNETFEPIKTTIGLA